MKGLIIYKSRYGATGQYAGWLARACGYRATQPESVRPGELEQAELVIVGSSIYLGKLLLSRWIRQHVRLLSRKKVLLFIVCGTTPDESEATEEMLLNNVPREILPSCRVFFLPGRIRHGSLSLKHRWLLKIAAWFETDRVKKGALTQDWDLVDRHRLEPLLGVIGELEPGLMAL